MDSFMDTFHTIINEVKLLWKSYPRFTSQSEWCAYYRNRNKSVPVIYLLVVATGFFTQPFRVAIMFWSEGSAIFSIMKYALAATLYDIVSIIVIGYMIKMKRLAEVKSEKENYAFHLSIAHRKQVAGCIYSILTTLFLISFNLDETHTIPLSLSWIVSTIQILYNLTWTFEGLRYKIVLLFIFNVAFSLSAKHHIDFQRSILDKIVIPVALCSVFLVVQDQSTKINFVLKRLLKGQKSVYEKFLQRLKDPVLIIEKEKLLFFNDAASSVIGRTAEDLYRKASFILTQDGRTLEESLNARLSLPGISPVPIIQEEYSMHEEESEILECQKRLIVTIIESSFFSRGKTIGLILRDITDDIIKENKRFENKFKNTILHSLSHELRTPLNILQEALRLAKGTDLEGERLECYQGGKGAWHHLRNKINDTLTYAQLLTDEFVLHSRSFSLGRFVAYLRKMTLYMLQKKREQVRLTFRVEENLADEFTGDRERLEQVMFNLLHNAVKYTTKGLISFEVYKQSADVVFSVSDTGCGVPESVANSLLLLGGPERLGRTRSAAKPFESIGLGLAVSSMIAHKMSGYITAFSVPSKGSTLKLSLPYKSDSGDILLSPGWDVVGEDPMFDIACRMHTWAGDSPGCPFSGSPKASSRIPVVESTRRTDGKVVVMIVDDNSFNRLVARRMLSKYFDELREAENGTVAVEKVQELQRSGLCQKLIVFMDLDMPVMNGLEATREIRKGNMRPRPYICALTAFADESERNSCFEAGMDWFISKPLTKENLQTLIAQRKFQVK